MVTGVPLKVTAPSGTVLLCKVESHKQRSHESEIRYVKCSGQGLPAVRLCKMSPKESWISGAKDLKMRSQEWKLVVLGPTAMESQGSKNEAQ